MIAEVKRQKTLETEKKMAMAQAKLLEENKARLASTDKSHTYSICLSNLPVGTTRETLLQALSEVAIITKGCAFTQTMDNRNEVEMWFKDDKMQIYNFDLLEKSRKKIAINGQDFTKVLIQRKQTYRV